MSNILVSGGTGFIGSPVAEELYKRDHALIVRFIRKLFTK
jgi:nucleoside-diphosphate-sugar epimerase